MTDALGSSERIPGSFRDPFGYVFRREDKIYRSVTEEGYAIFRETSDSGLLQDLIKHQFLVKTSEVSSPELLTALTEEHPSFQHFLTHETITKLSFPCEWSFSMLADAAILTLNLQIQLLQQGFSLKDASAYNVQFVDGRPLFIDLGSITKPDRLDVWFALGQFQRHFLFPLLLARFGGWDLHSYFVANLDGLPPKQVAKAFPGLKKWSPSLLLDLTLPLLFENSTDSKSLTPSEKVTTANAQLANLNRLKRKIKSLAAGYKVNSDWHHYTSTCNYKQESEETKKGLVQRFLASRCPKTVLDIGCNTGDYSFIATQSGAAVIATDADHDAIEILYHRLKKTPANITPVVSNLGNPSPGLGFMNTERAPFLERARSECVLALALIHHLLVSANLSLPAIAELFGSLTERHLVLEFVPVEDEQFQRLLKFRENLFTDLTLQTCLDALSPRFKLVESHPVSGTPRTLLFLEKHTDDHA